MRDAALRAPCCRVRGWPAAKDHIAASQEDKVWCARAEDEGFNELVLYLITLRQSWASEAEKYRKTRWEEGWAKRQTSKDTQANDSSDMRLLDSCHKWKLAWNQFQCAPFSSSGTATKQKMKLCPVMRAYCAPDSEPLSCTVHVRQPRQDVDKVHRSSFSQ